MLSRLSPNQKSLVLRPFRGRGFDQFRLRPQLRPELRQEDSSLEMAEIADIAEIFFFLEKWVCCHDFKIEGGKI